jgi:hypothetical protein
MTIVEPYEISFIFAAMTTINFAQRLVHTTLIVSLPPEVS